jgi:tRNA-2-methylthio-N6-dimethylallyladenosine synthase
MNKNDSERIAAALEKMGMKKAKDKNSADFIVLNTCSVRQTAEDRVFGEIHNFLKLKEKNKKLKVAVTGCLVGRDQNKEIQKKLKGVDLFFKIDELSLLKYLLYESDKPNRSNKSYKFYLSIPTKAEFSASRYLTIQTGCNEFCSYCVVPYARGREYNRSLQEIFREAKKLIREGAIEITLLGQIVNKWVAPDTENFSKNNPFRPADPVSPIKSINHIRSDFPALLWELNQLPKLKRIHFISPHPKYMSDDLIQTLALPKMANYLHLAAQSGDDRILKKMNRKYSAADYLKIIRKVRKAKPNIELGTDIIVGFPGETERQFGNTVEFCKKVKFDVAYIAMYSPRSGTAAYKNYPDNVPREVKKRRWLILNNLINKITEGLRSPKVV